MLIKPTPLHTAKIRFFVALCTLFGLPITTTLRFIPKEQKRLDLRGRTITAYEFFGDALRDLKSIHDGTYNHKEPEHGSYYLAIEIRSSSVERLGAGRRSKDTITVPLPLKVPERVSGTPDERAVASLAAQTAHDERVAGDKDGTVRGRAAGSEAVAEPERSMGVDSSKIELDSLNV